MIPVFFNNQNYTTMTINEAKDMILASTKANVTRTYLDCWRSVTPSSDKVKLEKWWLNNNSQFKLKEGTQEEKEVYRLVLTPEERRACERELAEMEQDLEEQEEYYYTQLELDLLTLEELN
jgi:hypothetical protein